MPNEFNRSINPLNRYHGTVHPMLEAVHRYQLISSTARQSRLSGLEIGSSA
jgi:hypothetical protein